MKTRNRRMIIWFLLIALLVPFFSISSLRAAENKTWPKCPSVQTEAALVMDVNTGTVLIENNGTKKAYPASITKIMTALLAIEHATSLDEKVIFTKEAIEIKDRESSSIGMLPGEELTLRECLYALMLASANEVANALAIHVSGGIEEFVDLMNEKAEELGCVNTHFNNPNGLHDPDHYTCALDMAKIAGEAIKNEDFKTIAGTRAYVIPETNLMDEKRPVANYHQMINPAKYPQYAYEYCYAGKTGYTRDAGMTLVSFAKKGTMNLVCVILKADTRDAQYGGTMKLLNYCFKRFRMEQAEKVALDYKNSKLYATLLEKDPLVDFYIPSASMIVIPKRSDWKQIETAVNYESPEFLPRGESEVGQVEYRYNGKTIGTYPLLYKTSEDIVLVEKKAEDTKEKEMESEGQGDKGERESDGKLLIYKISSVIGIMIIIATFLTVLFSMFRKKRGNRFYIHKSLRKRWRRKNRRRR